MDNQQLPDPSNIDPIWTTSRTARQIYALGQVEKVFLVLVPDVCSVHQHLPYHRT